MKSAFRVCCGQVSPKPISCFQVKDSGTFHPKHPTLATGSFGLKAVDKQQILEKLPACTSQLPERRCVLLPCPQEGLSQWLETQTPSVWSWLKEST